MTNRLPLLIAAATLAVPVGVVAQNVGAQNVRAQPVRAQITQTIQPARVRSDTDGNGITSRAEASAAAAAAFARFDINADNRLTMADREQMRSVRRAQRFAAMDNNNDGSISGAEWAAAEQARETRLQGRRGPDGPDGSASTPGVGDDRPGFHGFHRRGQHGHHGGRGGRGGAMRAPGNGIDADRDGAVSREEFVARAMGNFDRADANHDGNVTAAERTVARAARMDRRGRGAVGG